jgi:hypothetical protein
MKVRLIAGVVLALVFVAGCSNGKNGGGLPSLDEVKAQAALAQANNQKAIEAAQNNPSLSDDQKASLIARLNGTVHGHGRPTRIR